MRKLFIIFALVFMGELLFAQAKYDEQPKDKQETMFLFAEFGLPNNENVKAVVFTRYIYRYRYGYGYNEPALTVTSVRTMMTNAFTKKIEEIKQNEFNAKASNYYNQVTGKQRDLIYAVITTGAAFGNGPKPSALYYSTTEHLIKTREILLAEYRSKGYRIFQADFDEYFDADIKALRLEKISALSFVDYPYYNSSDIRNMARRYQENTNSNSSSSGIVIESSDDKKNSGNKQSTKKEKKDWALQVEMNRIQAEQLEIEGDRLYSMGTVFYLQALEKYKEAQKLYPTARVQARIDEINALASVAQSIIDIGEGVGEGIESADPMKKTRRAYGFLSYTGFLGNYDKIMNGGEHAPMSAYFGASMHRIFLSLELRFGYMVLPVYEYQVGGHNSSGNEVLYENFVQVEHTGVTMGFSGGINIPLKNIMFYGMYGTDMAVFYSKSESLTPGFSLEDQDAFFPMGLRKWSFGANVNIPKTKLSIGLHYHLNNYKGEEDSYHAVTYETDPGRKFTLRKTTEQEYKFNQAGVSFMWRL